MLVFSQSDSKLPNPFEKPNKSDENEQNNASEHNGRIRLFPHERGNWATYVYIHCKSYFYLIESGMATS